MIYPSIHFSAVDFLKTQGWEINLIGELPENKKLKFKLSGVDRHEDDKLRYYRKVLSVPRGIRYKTMLEDGLPVKKLSALDMLAVMHTGKIEAQALTSNIPLHLWPEAKIIAKKEDVDIKVIKFQDRLDISLVTNDISIPKLTEVLQKYNKLFVRYSKSLS